MLDDADSLAGERRCETKVYPIYTKRSS